jgi:hypothetical protein
MTLHSACPRHGFTLEHVTGGRASRAREVKLLENRINAETRLPNMENSEGIRVLTEKIDCDHYNLTRADLARLAQCHIAVDGDIAHCDARLRGAAATGKSHQLSRW